MYVLRIGLRLWLRLALCRASGAVVTWEGLNPPYATLVVDPPWHYDKVNPDNPWMNVRPEARMGYSGGPLNYSSLSLQEIQDLQVADLAADDARLYLWTTNRYLRHAWDVVEAWGFTPLGRTLVWCKPPRGTTSVTTEFVVMGTRGHPPKLPWHNTTWFQWPRQSLHSAKPPQFFDLVESWSPGPYVELFARSPRLGWDHWGYGYEAAS